MKSGILKANDLYSSMRMDGSYHLSAAVIYEKTITQREYKLLSDYSSRIFTAGRNKRVYTSKDYGYPYLSNSDVVSLNPFMNCNYNSKKYGFDNNAFLKQGMIVTGRVGAIGQTAYINEEFEKKQAMGSDNIIRIVAKDLNLSGFLFAFLRSKYGTTFLWKYATGGVQPYINEKMVGLIPIPIFPSEKQDQIHSLISQAAKLRVTGNNNLDIIRSEVEQLIGRVMNFSFLGCENHSLVSIKDIKQLEQRFDAPYNTGLGRKIYERIIADEYILLSSVAEVFLPILFGKKQLKGTLLKGNALYKSSSMMQLKPESDFRLSIKKIAMYTKLQVKKGWVLVSRTGTVGNVVRITERLNNIFIDDHMVRIIPKEDYSGFIYIFLSTLYGQELIKFQKYGSVQDVINSDYIGRIPIPKWLTEKSFLKRVQESVEDAHKMIDQANLLEEEAIRLIETEIEQWQQ